MNKFATISLYFFSVVALSWFLPWLLSLLIPKSAPEPFLQWSPVSDEWIFTVTGDDKAQEIYTIDASGNRTATYTKAQRDSLLPMLYYRDLMKRQQMPETVNGKEMSVHNIRNAEMNFNSNPRDINKNVPQVYLIMESMPVGATFDDPSEVFRFTPDGGIEFVDMATNKVNTKRSARFTKVMKREGFAYPPRHLNANVTARKNRDDGYLIADANGVVFHMKQQAGRPYLEHVNMPEGVEANYVYVFENEDPTYLGMFVDQSGDAWFITTEGHRPIKIDAGPIDPSVDRINVMGNMMNIVLRMQGKDSTRWVAIDHDTLQTLGRYTYERPKSAVAAVKTWLLPYQLDFNSQRDSYATPRLSNFSMHALIVNAVLAVILAIVLVRRRRAKVETVVLTVLTLPLGLYMAIPAYFITKD